MLVFIFSFSTTSGKNDKSGAFRLSLTNKWNNTNPFSIKKANKTMATGRTQNSGSSNLLKDFVVAKSTSVHCRKADRSASKMSTTIAKSVQCVVEQCTLLFCTFRNFTPSVEYISATSSQNTHLGPELIISSVYGMVKMMGSSKPLTGMVLPQPRKASEVTLPASSEPAFQE